MKKRLRKRRHLGQFSEWGAPIAVMRTHKSDFDSFLDDFIEQARGLPEIFAVDNLHGCFSGIEIV
jgi:uncharacterized protein YggL (DUF469 family)